MRVEQVSAFDGDVENDCACMHGERCTVGSIAVFQVGWQTGWGCLVCWLVDREQWHGIVMTGTLSDTCLWAAQAL
jgi:hypothetical protein